MIPPVTVLVLVIAGLHAVTEAQNDDKFYTSRYDHINLEDVLNNERLFKRYFQCLLEVEDVHCTPDGKALKKVLPEALTTNCSKCTDKQNERTQTVIRHLIVKRPHEWVRLGAKYDPERKYTPHYETLYGSNGSEASATTEDSTKTGGAAEAAPATEAGTTAAATAGSA